MSEDKVDSAINAKSKADVINAAHLLKRARAANPQGLKMVDDVIATRLIRTVLAELGSEIRERTEGAVQVVGLGHFAIRQRNAKPKEEGAEPTKVKRVVFRATKAKPGGGIEASSSVADVG